MFNSPKTRNQKADENMEVKSKLYLPSPNNFWSLNSTKKNSEKFSTKLNIRKTAYAISFLFRMLLFLVAVFKPEFVLINLFEQSPNAENIKVILFHSYHLAVPLVMATTAMIIESERSKIINILLVISDLLSSWAVYKLNYAAYSLFSIILTVIYSILIIDNIIIYASALS